MPARRFQFRLQTVLEYKQKREEEEQRELSRRIQILAAEEKRLASLKRLQRKRLKEMAQKSGRGPLNVEELKMYHEQQKKLAREVSDQSIKVQQASADAELQRAKLLEARKEAETFKKLRDKHRAAYEAELNLEEQKMIDEIATAKFSRENERFF